MPSTPRPHAPVLLVLLLAAAAVAGCRQSEQSDNVSPLARELQVEDFQQPEAIRPTTWLAAGRLAESRGDLAGAAGQYRKALAAVPDDREAMYRLGVVLSRLRDPEAVTTWRRYIALTRNSAEGWANLGLCYELLEEPLHAEESYRKGIARDPANAACRVNFGMFLAARGDYQAAAAQFAAALPPAQGWYNIGSVCEQQGKKAEAILAYQKALEIDPGLVVAQRRLTAISIAAPAPADRVTSTDPGGDR